MLNFLANRTTAHPRRILLATAVLVVFAAAVGGPVFGLLQTEGGFTNANSDSARAVVQVEQATGLAASPEVVALLEPESPVRTAAGRAEVAALANELGAIPGA